MLPALDHVVRSQTSTTDSAPTIDACHVQLIYSSVKRLPTPVLLTVQTALWTGPSGARAVQIFYEHLDKHYADLARVLLLGTTEDDATLIQYIIPCSKGYNVGARSVNRLLNYVNRHHVKHAVDEGRGWLTLTDNLDAVAHSIKVGDTRERIAKMFKEKRVEGLKKWRYEENGSPKSLVLAKQRAEAASILGRVIPLEALASRRFGTEYIKPLLAAPKARGKRRRPGVALHGDMSLPKSQLSRAVRELLEIQEINPGQRKKLEKFLTTGPGVDDSSVF